MFLAGLPIFQDHNQNRYNTIQYNTINTLKINVTYVLVKSGHWGRLCKYFWTSVRRGMLWTRKMYSALERELLSKTMKCVIFEKCATIGRMTITSRRRLVLH